MSPTHTHTHSHTLCLPDTHDDVKTSSSFSPDRPFVQPSARDRPHSRSNWSARLLVLCKAQDYIINEFIILPVCYFDKYIYIYLYVYIKGHTPSLLGSRCRRPTTAVLRSPRIDSNLFLERALSLSLVAPNRIERFC